MAKTLLSEVAYAMEAPECLLPHLPYLFQDLHGTSPQSPLFRMCRASWRSSVAYRNVEFSDVSWRRVVLGLFWRCGLL
jgi:hypothetical protein